MSLTRDKVVVGKGRTMPNMKSAHNHKLRHGWVVVCISYLCKKDLACWEEYPTASGTLEEQSFSAWPKKEMRKSIQLL